MREMFKVTSKDKRENSVTGKCLMYCKGMLRNNGEINFIFSLTVYRRIILVGNQLDAQFLL